MQDSSVRTAKTIRMKQDVYHQARVAAVISRKSLAEWLEEAISEKLARDPQPTEERVQ